MQRPEDLLANRFSAPFRHRRAFFWLAALAWLMVSLPAWTAELQKLHGHVPPATARLKPTGQLDDATQLNLAIGLPLRNPDALAKLLQDLYDPKSPSYGKYLTPAQFTANFGPTNADYQAVIKFARAHRLKVTNSHPNRLILDVSGAAADIEKALNVKLLTYAHPTQARQFFAPDVEPSLALSVPVLFISGLDNYSPPQPLFRPMAAASAGQAVPDVQGTGSSPGGGFAGADFRAAYVPGASLTGAGQSVGLLEFDAYYASDITSYETAFNLPNVPLVNVSIDGGVFNPGSGDTEVSLDIEMVVSMAPGVSSIYVYEAPNTAPFVDVLSRMANDNRCSQLSSSWAGGGPNPSAETIFQQMAAQGQSFFQASGDSDAYTGAIPFPSDSPHITVVGGTMLNTTGPGGSYVSETVWNTSNGEGSSGGISTTYSIPSWQTGINMTASQGSTTMRNSPDVALTAYNVYVTEGNGQSQIGGGTSCAAPLWAGLTALVNQQAALYNHPTVGFLNPTLYNIGAGSSYNSNFHDITSGNNFSTNSPAKFAAVTGYDLCTGLGTPLGGGLLFTLGGPYIPTIVSVTPGNAVAGDSVTITGTNFYGVTNVAFNGFSAIYTVNSATQITATVPAGATAGPITVTTAGGTATSPANFLLFAVVPAYGLPGTGVTISGSGFTNASAVSFNGVSAMFNVISDTQIIAAVPAGATTGPVSVVTPAGTITSLTVFTVLTGDGTPSISSFTPGSGAVGANVTITGTNFAGVTAVSFAGTAASFTVNSQTQITAVVPAPIISVSGPITVTTTQGSATSGGIFQTFATLAIYNSPLTVPVVSNNFSPTGNSVYFVLTFPPAAGTNLTVIQNTGAGFINGTYTNLAQGQQVVLTYNGVNYNFVANYYGGAGNDLVLQWANTRPLTWGNNANGQLGNNSSTNSLIPSAASTAGSLAGETILSTAMGGNHSLALCADGTIDAWGLNTNGQLGNATTASSLLPLTIPTTGTALAGKTVIAVAAGQSHSLALCSDGTLAAWGYNFYGQLGNNSTTQSLVPVAVTTTGTALAGKTVVAIAAGQYHNLALCSDGTLAAWGNNSSGQLGNNSTTNSSVPVAVNTTGALAGKTVVALAGGGSHSLALCSDGTVVAWGLGSSGQLGNNSLNNSLVPALVPTAGTALAGQMVTAIAAGQNHSLALCQGGIVAAWGNDAFGQLGNNSTANQSTPTIVTTSGALAGEQVSAIAAGANHSMAFCVNGSVASWGENNDGQLGNDSTGNSSVPVTVVNAALAAGEAFAQISSGQSAFHNLAIVATPPEPQIIVQQPAGTNLISESSTVNFGNVSFAAAPLTFTIVNTGAESLSINNVLVVGPDNSDFLVTTPPSNSVAPGSSTTLVVTFAPTAGLSIGRNATLQISSNDPNNGLFNINLTGSSPATLAAVYNSPNDVPLTVADGFTATGSTVNFALNFPPAVGTNLTVVNNLGLGFISGTFGNLVQGQAVALSYAGVAYHFVANYYGGSGNDLVLQWAENRPVSWGLNNYGQLANDNPIVFPEAVAVSNSGALAGKTIVSLATGQYHSLALCSDGTLAAWGLNSNGQLGNNSLASTNVPVAVTVAGTPLAGKTVIAVAAGQSHSLALCSDGTIAAWGLNADGQLGNNTTTGSMVPVAVTTTGTALAGKTVKAIAGGGFHSLALCSDGTVAAWGLNADGQLGNNSTANSSVPVAVTTAGTPLAGATVTAIAAGQLHTLALCANGTVVAWGYNFFGQLGNKTTNNSLVASTVYAAATLSGKTVTALAAGLYHSLALCSDGSVAAWGYGFYGQLGNNTQFDTSVALPVVASGTALQGKTVTAISAGSYHSIGLCSDGSVATWGSSSYGQLGNDTTSGSLVPVAVLTTGTALAGKTVNAISAGGYHNLVRCTDGSLAAWGADLYGELGNDDPLNSPTPGAVITSGALAGKTLTMVAAGQYHSVALCSDGTVITWGSNTNGQLGNDQTGYSITPVVVNTAGTALAGKTVVAVAAGLIHSMALCSDGTVATWGGNIFGQLGDAFVTQSLVPVAVNTYGVLAGRTVVAIASGSSHCLALCSDGTLVTWGENNAGQLGNSTTTNSASPVLVETAGTPLAGKTVTAIAAGGSHNLVLCSDGTLVSWGANSDGQLGNGSAANSLLPVAVNTSGMLFGETVVSISAGLDHSLALCADGTLATWGYGAYGQLGNNGTSNSSVPVAVSTSGVLSGKTVSAISCGQYHSVANCSDGTVATWGYNVDGELGNGSYTNSLTPVLINTASLAAGEVFVQAVSGQSASHNLALVAEPLSPEIDVEQPAGTVLASGSSTVSFGGSSVGAGVPLTFTIRDIGSAVLTISSATIDGPNGSDFQVTTPPASTVDSGASTTLVVTFTPSATFSRSATLHIVSNDPNTGTFNVGLTGAGIFAATYNSAADVPLTVSSGFTATGGAVSFTLNYAPTTGTNLTVLRNTGLGFIGGNFANLAQGQAVVLTYGGVNYNFVANYYGGNGNDLVLQWANNRPVSWGLDIYGQLGNNSSSVFSVPVGITTSGVLAGKTIVALSAGQYHTLALCSDGTLAAWGNNSNGQLGNNSTANSNVPVAVTTAGTPLAGKSVIAIAAGGLHSVCLCADGTIAAWGFNADGQLGNNSTTQSLVPVVVTTTGTPLAGKTAVAVAAGEGHSMALCADGTLVTWGFNSSGQLGNNSTTNSSVPVAVNTSGVLAGKTISAIAAGQLHSVALCSDGTVAAWGLNTYGALGNNSTTNSPVPVAVNTAGVLAGKAVTSISAGIYHSLALCSDGTLAAWGANFDGQLGNGGTANSSVPVAVTLSGVLSGKTITTISAGWFHGEALCSDGTISSWGLNSTGQLGNNSTAQSNVPVLVTTTGSPIAGKLATALTGGGYHNLVLCSDGTVAAWGNDLYGELGNDNTLSYPVPVAVNTSGVLAGKTVTALCAGQYHSLALCADGTLAAWGYNDDSQLGNSTTALSSVPATLSSAGALAGKTIVTVAAGQNHSLALCADGTVAAWGYNGTGQLGNNSFTNSSVPVAVNTSGVLSGKTVVAIAAGNGHSVALCSDGTVAAWGLNANGQLGNNSTTTSSVPVAVSTTGVLSGKTVVAVAAGGLHSVALCSDGTVSAWGNGSSGQLGNNSSSNSSVPVAVATTGILSGKTVTAVAAGQLHNLALCADATLAAWGSNVHGELGNGGTVTSIVPVAVSTTGVLSGKTVAAISAGEYHSLALCSDGTAVTWGYDADGELGNNGSTNSSVPVLVNTASLATGEVFTQSTSGSTAFHSLSLIAEPPTVVTTQQGTQTDLTGQTATFSVSVAGIGPFTYQWYYNGTAIPGATGPSYTVNNLASGSAGSYWVVATNLYGSTTSSQYTLTVSPGVPAMPPWGLLTLPMVLLLIAARHLPKKRVVSGISRCSVFTETTNRSGPKHRI